MSRFVVILLVMGMGIPRNAINNYSRTLIPLVGEGPGSIPVVALSIKPKKTFYG